MLNSLYDVGALTGDSADTHTTNGIQLFVRKGRAVFDSEGAASEDKLAELEELLGDQASSQQQDLVETYRLNLEAALMTIVVAMCNPVIYVFSDPNGCRALLKLIAKAAGKVEIDDRRDRRLVAVYNKYEGKDTKPLTRACFKNITRHVGLQELFPGGIECALIPNLRNSRDDYDGAVGDLRGVINQMPTKALRLDTLLKTTEKITDHINSATGTLYLDAMVMAVDKERCEVAVEAQKELFRMVCQPEALLSREEFGQHHDKAVGALVLDGVPATLTKVYAGQLSTFLWGEFNGKLRECTAKCSCPNRGKCTLGNVAHEGADRHMHQCEVVLRCSRGCGVLRCEEERKCPHCPRTCPTHHRYCIRERQQHSSFCEFECTDSKPCSACGFEFPRKNCTNGKVFTCACCAQGGHDWQGHHHQKVNVPSSNPIVHAFWHCAVQGCDFHDGMYRWDQLGVDRECTSICANAHCGLFRVRGRIVGSVTKTHGGWGTSAACLR
jgi:hypothetical protein